MPDTLAAARALPSVDIRGVAPGAAVDVVTLAAAERMDDVVDEDASTRAKLHR